MIGSEVTMVRIYLQEGEVQLRTLLKRMRDWEKVRGLSVFRGVSGFGESGEIHAGDLIDLAGHHMPLVVEFFDEPDKVAGILDHLSDLVKPGHMTWWNVRTNLDNA